MKDSYVTSLPVRWARCEVATVGSPPYRGQDSKAMVAWHHKDERIVLMIGRPIDARR